MYITFKMTKMHDPLWTEVLTFTFLIELLCVYGMLYVNGGIVIWSCDLVM